MFLSSLLLASTITGLSLFLLRHVARYLHLMDPIKGHKTHTKETAVVGGIAIMLGILSMAFTAPISFAYFFLPINLAVLIMISGILDDAFGLTSLVRLSTQIALGGIVFYIGGIQFLGLGDILFIGSVNLGIFALPFTIIAICGAVNSVNWMDGLDGLAGGLVLITLGFLGVLSYLSSAAGTEESFQLISVASASVFVFLLFNYRFPGRKSAMVFMGDGGAYPLGFLIACLFIVGSQGSNAFLTPILALWIMAIPLLDIARVIWGRIKRGENLTAPGRDHIQHLLIDYGYTTPSVVLILHFAAILFGSFGMLLHFTTNSSIMFATFISLCAAYFLGIAILVRRVEELKAIE